MKNTFLDAMQMRFACKKFDSQKTISQEDFTMILQAARLTPSSFGLEHTRILVIENTQLRKQMQPLCWNQEQIVQASKIVVLTAKLDLDSQSNYATKMFQRKTGKDTQALIDYKDKRYHGFLISNGYTDSQSIYNWSSRQTYLVASSMMNCASFLHIDSCPIEGFDKKSLESLLGLDTFIEQVTLIIAFGYHSKKPEKKAPRLEIDALVRFYK